jgi:ABC-type antimicrobial peptide transport system permease subunit
MNQAAQPVVEMRNLVKSYRRGDQIVPVLTGITFDIAAGDYVSTMNWQSFSELAFSFTLTPEIVVRTLLFALIMGMVGGFLPAIRAARLNIVDALRAI